MYKVCTFSAYGKKKMKMAPNEAMRLLFLLIRTLPTLWANRMNILISFMQWIIWIPDSQIYKFLDFQISKFPTGPGPSMGCGPPVTRLSNQREEEALVHGLGGLLQDRRATPRPHLGDGAGCAAPRAYIV